MQNPSRKFDFNKILEENGLDQDKMDIIESYHPGFSSSILEIASKPNGAITMYRKDLEKRARMYLRNKRRKAGIKKKDIAQDVKENLKGSASSSREVLSQEKAYYGKGEIKKSKLEVKKDLRQEYNSSFSQNQPSIVYHGPVFNNCSFGANAMSNIVPSPVFGRPLIQNINSLKRDILSLKRLKVRRGLEVQ